MDYDDYLWACRYKWAIKWSRGGKKCYLYRTGRDENGKTKSEYLHVEIMKRTGIEPPSPEHTITDHRDGNSLHCRRKNLRWATLTMNRQNRFGSHPHDLVDG